MISTQRHLQLEVEGNARTPPPGDDTPPTDEALPKGGKITVL